MFLFIEIQKFSLALISVLFCWAAIMKFFYRENFVMTLESLPYDFGIFFPKILGWFIIWTELFIALGMVLNLLFAKLACLLLLIVFILVTQDVIRKDRIVECNCFGFQGALFSKWTVFRNLLFIVILTIGMPLKESRGIVEHIPSAIICSLIILCITELVRNNKQINELRKYIRK